MAEAARLFPVNEETVEPARKSPSRKAAVPKPPVLVEVAASEPAPRSALMFETMRIAEAMVFAAEAPLEESEIAKRMPEGLKAADVMYELRKDYEKRGVNLVRVGSKWTFRTAGDLGWLLSREMQQQKKLSRAALETLAIIAYHQPTTRAEIEDIRGVAISKGTLDVLMETGWVRLRGRRKAPGRPVTYGTTDDFLLHFGLEGVSDLPGLEELKGAGLFDGRLPPGFGVPTPNDSAELAEDEDPLEDGDLLDFAEGAPDFDSESGEMVEPVLEAAAQLQDEQDAEDGHDAREIATEGNAANESVEAVGEHESPRESVESIDEPESAEGFEEPGPRDRGVEE